MFNKSLVIILVFAFVCIIQTPAQSQEGMGCTDYQRVFANNQWQLPVQSPSYTPCGSYYDWHIEFLVSGMATEWSGVRFRIVGADLNKLYTTETHPTGGPYSYDGSGYTGSGGVDYLRIENMPDSDLSFMGLMELELVRTYNKTPN
ncbi:MAG: hypothetical protein J7K40_05415 [candidate division Zixibacteria bacterium]|nr:hypothetical protein [candidate division Zixibacteria bacterium]